MVDEVFEFRFQQRVGLIECTIDFLVLCGVHLCLLVVVKDDVCDNEQRSFAYI